jgi:hypothetical protein
MTDRIDKGSAIRAAGGGGVLLRRPYEKQSVLVELPPGDPAEPADPSTLPYYTPPGLNGIEPTTVRPMDQLAWEQSRHQRAAEYHTAHPPENSVSLNPFAAPVGYTPPVTHAAAEYEDTVLGLTLDELIGVLEHMEAGNPRLDAQIHHAIGRGFGHRDVLPPYTSDPNAAAQVDPQGVTHEIQPDVVILRGHGTDPPREFKGEHANAAIARCLAALKARFEL